jgi:23S rRNA pseudouridine2605 synthase
MEPKSTDGEKLHKVLARAGLGSRRQMETWIEQGRVKINGKMATIGDRVNEQDKVMVDGQVVPVKQENDLPTRLLMYNKPEGEVCTRTDPQGRPTVFDKLPAVESSRWVAIGRLDINTTGLMLFTTDGDLANRLMHPSSRIEREYAVRVRGNIGDDTLGKLLTGVMLEDGLAKFDEVFPGEGEGQNKWFYVVIREGKKREVRRLWEALGAQVSRLIRTRYASVVLPRDLPQGRYLELAEDDIRKLAAASGAELKKRSGLYGRPKFKVDHKSRKPDDGDDGGDDKNKRSGYLRRRRN